VPIWRCPHCATPQAETDRCWVCRRSSTSCLTCRHFRRSVAARLNYCGLDPRRLPLGGDEIRPCWEARPAEQAIPGAAEGARHTATARSRATLLDFVALEPEPTATPPPAAPSERVGGLWPEFD
jgi:hypothetical protein